MLNDQLTDHVGYRLPIEISFLDLIIGLCRLEKTLELMRREAWQPLH